MASSFTKPFTAIAGGETRTSAISPPQHGGSLRAEVIAQARELSGASAAGHNESLFLAAKLANRPLVPRPATPRRPHSSCRFVQNTLDKLGDDNERMLSRPVSAACTNFVLGGDTGGAALRSVSSRFDMWDPVTAEYPALVQPLSHVNPTSDRPVQTGGDDAVKQPAQEEVSECIKSLRCILDSTESSSFTSQIDNWRKFDHQITSLMKTHLDELVDLHKSLRKFEVEYLSTDPFLTFQSTIAELKKGVDELEQARRHSEISIPKVAELASSRIGSDISMELRMVAEPWGTFMQEQRTRWTDDDERWARLERTFENLYRRLERLDGLSTRDEMVGEVSRVSTLVSKGFEPVLRDVVRDISGATQLASKHVAESIRDGMVTTSVATQKMVHDSSQDMIARMTSVEVALGGYDKRLQDLADISAREEQNAATVAGLQGDVQRASEETERVRAEGEIAREECARLQAEVDNDRKVTNTIRNELQAALESPASKAMRSIKSVEARGNIRIDLAAGTLTFLKHIVFSPAKPSSGQPTAEFRNAPDVEKILNDVAEMAVMFGVPLVLEGYAKATKGGKDAGSAAFWEDVATARAELVRKDLARRGVPNEMMKTKGTVKKGQSADLSLTFDSADIFPKEKVSLARGKSPQGAGSSPSRGRSP
eukprot:TRINITY_DN19246_c0_g1_i1.p1 TRINITY_DN19246_c0_g1~~TRINITY_DN19246_c0_g1_i1.p1  ORF type:complete len:670 (-),score=106.96 TRINITY_DN19246_c0_g1_i1:125-2089(-)